MGEWVAVYHHWDSYPEGLGATLYEAYNGFFKKDLSKMLKYLMEDHTGWSTIVGANFKLKPGYEDIMNRQCGKCRKREKTHEGADHAFEPARRPKCYCHGDRAEVNEPFTQAEASSMGVEWAYVLDPATRLMYVLGSFDRNGSKMIGMFGAGNPDATWTECAAVALDGPAPDWDKVTCGEHLERCGHYAWAHFPKLKDWEEFERIDTAAFLGHRPMEVRDAYAAVWNGVTYVLTGSGRSATAGKTRWWMADGRASNGRKRELALYEIDAKGKERVADDIQLVYPRTKAQAEAEGEVFE
jgi:hypothetical protein